MFKKRQTNKPARNLRMNDINLEDDNLPSYVEVDEVEDDAEAVEVIGRKNRGSNRVNIFGANN